MCGDAGAQRLQLSGESADVSQLAAGGAGHGVRREGQQLGDAELAPEADVDAQAGELVLLEDPEVVEGVAPGRRIYLHVARGQVTANGESLVAGDALKLSGEPVLRLTDGHAAEVLVFDLPGGPD